MTTLPDDDLTQLALRITETHDAAMSAAKTAVERAIECGRLMIEAKGKVPHGEWLAWLSANTNISHRTAQRFMRAAAEASKNDIVSYSSVRALLEHGSSPRARKLPWWESSSADEVREHWRQWPDGLAGPAIYLDLLGLPATEVAAKLHTTESEVCRWTQPKPPAWAEWPNDDGTDLDAALNERLQQSMQYTFNINLNAAAASAGCCALEYGPRDLIDPARRRADKHRSIADAHWVAMRDGPDLPGDLVVICEAMAHHFCRIAWGLEDPIEPAAWMIRAELAARYVNAMRERGITFYDSDTP